MSRVEWVNPDTGEVLDGEQEGAVPCPVCPPEVIADAQAFGDWYTRELVSLEARTDALKAQHKRALRKLTTEADRLARLKPELEIATRSLLVGDSKTVQFAYGSASFRSSKRTEVLDEELAKEWAMLNAPDAVKVEIKLLVSKLPVGECPHVKLDDHESFSAKGAK